MWSCQHPAFLFAACFDGLRAPLTWAPATVHASTCACSVSVVILLALNRKDISVALYLNPYTPPLHPLSSSAPSLAQPSSTTTPSTSTLFLAIRPLLQHIPQKLKHNLGHTIGPAFFLVYISSTSLRLSSGPCFEQIFAFRSLVTLS